MALKKCSKLHKIFLAELERCERMDREGAQVLSSLANVAMRVPLLAEQRAATADVSPGAVSPFGVLDFLPDTSARLLEKHFLAMEKSASFLRDIVKDLVDAVRRLRGFVDEFVELVEDVPLVVMEEEDVEEEEEKEERSSPVGAALGLLEWMENVRTMYERDVLRKRLLVADVEYWDVARLQRMHREWPASASVSFVDVAYVRMGTEELPPLSTFSTAADEQEPAEDSISSTSETISKKNKKKKKKKQAKTG